MNNNEEKLLREYIRHSLTDQVILSEGIKDVLKKALESGLSTIKSLLGRLESSMDSSLEFRNILKKNGGDEVVSKIDAAGEEFKVAIKDAGASTPAGKNESRRFIHRGTNRRREHALDEVALGGFEIVGFALAVVGGVPLILKAAYKLMQLLGFKEASEKLEVAYEKSHHFEEAVIDYAIPDKALYAIYITIQEKKNPAAVANLKIYQADPAADEKSTTTKSRRALDAFGRAAGKELKGRSAKRSMTFEEFVKSDERKQYEKRVWALILIPWLYAGLSSLHHLFSGIIGVMEGAATGVKAIEVGTAAAEAAPTIASEITSAVSALAKAV